jgi:hypothetical protein
MKKKTVVLEPVRVGILSRVDFGSVGYRRGLLELAWDIFRKEKVHFIVIAGGLVNQDTLLDAPPKKKEEQAEYIAALTRQIADVIPRMEKPANGNGGVAVNGNGNGKNHENGDHKELVRTYIVTSKPFDGWVGGLVAKELPELRDDIRYQGQGHVTFRIKQIGKLLRVLVPEKKPWRSQYYGTPAQNLVIDDIQRTTSPVFDLYVCGCLASSVLKPGGGDFESPFITVPALHKLEQVSASENQIGLKVVEFSPHNGIRVRTYNFKDFVSKERELVNIPANSSETQGAVINALKQLGPLTTGLLADTLKIDREEIQKEIEALKRFRAGIVYDEGSGRYDFSQDWFREKIRYHWPKEEEFREDTLVGFGCLHAGGRYCDAEYFVRDVPDLILRWKANGFIGAGDFLEGLKHHLLERGEVFGGFNNTLQERLAGLLVGMVMLKVFKVRFDAVIKGRENLSQDELRAIVMDALITFFYVHGNHDEWQMDMGFTPLSEFRSTLINFLQRNIDNILAERNLALSRLYETIENRVIDIHRKEVTLPSGVTMAAFHPHNARMKAVTGRMQELFWKSKASVIFAANWHVSVGVEHWSPARGQQVGVQVPTIKISSDYEENKGKKLDFGVGLVRIKVHRGKILMNETLFHGTPRLKEAPDNEVVLRDLLRKLGMDEVVGA